MKIIGQTGWSKIIFNVNVKVNVKCRGSKSSTKALPYWTGKVKKCTSSARFVEANKLKNIHVQ